MSRSPVRFKGLRHPQTKGIFPIDYLGDPCLYQKHNLSKNSQCWRDGYTHACQSCLEDIRKNQISLDTSKLTKSSRRQALKFWSKVEFEDWDSCWRWTGRPIKNQLYYVWRRPNIRSNWGFHPVQVCMWLSWGDVARSGSMSLCGNRRCVNPLHNLPLDLADVIDTSSIPRDYLDSQLNLLHSQLKDFHSLLQYEAQKKSSVNSNLFDPTITAEEKQSIISCGGVTPFQQLFNQTQDLLHSGKHTIFSTNDELDD